MLKRLSRTLLPALAISLPLTALSAPVNITTTTSGMLQSTDFVIFSALGLDVDPTLPAPYEMTLQSLFDYEPPSPGMPGAATYFYSTDVSVTLRVGTSVFEHSGKALTILYPDTASHSYSQRVLFNASIDYYDVYFENRIVGAPGSVDGDVLLPRQLTSSGPGAGNMYIDMYRSNPDAPGEWNLWETADRAALTVLNPVPEPEHWSMLAAGLLVVSTMARRGRRRSLPSS